MQSDRSLTIIGSLLAMTIVSHVVLASIGVDPPAPLEQATTALTGLLTGVLLGNRNTSHDPSKAS